MFHGTQNRVPPHLRPPTHPGQRAKIKLLLLIFEKHVRNNIQVRS